MSGPKTEEDLMRLRFAIRELVMGKLLTVEMV